MKRYIACHPLEAKYFFVQMDGCPLQCWNVIDMLNVCVLQMTHCHLRILPHRLCFGGLPKNAWMAPTSWISDTIAISRKQVEP